MIRTEKVSLDSDGVTLVGTLHLPAATPDDGPHPAVVVAGTWTSVKEQMADRYARRLAALGFAALAFDFTGYGESGGDPRDFESPSRKIRDIRNAYTFLGSRPEIDGDRLGALGICAGAMYMAANTAVDARVRSLALVAPWLHDGVIVGEVYGGAEGVAEKIAAGERARSRFDETGEVEYVPVVSATDPRAPMPYDIDFYLNPSRGGIPQWPNRFAVMSWPGWLGFDAVTPASAITQPTLVVHSEDAAIPEGARRFFDLLPGSKEFTWTSGSQFDFYDQESNVTIAVDAVGRHFARTLKGTQG
jgi:fermentation-respiration switch protein FrsA (DUF1100 family)